MNKQGKMREDTRTILRVGSGMMIGAVIAALEVVLTGGMGGHGPKADAGWIGLLFALGLAPMGGFLLVLGLAKWRTDLHR